MPRGGKRSQKGRNRQFTSVEELETQTRNEQKWRNKEAISEEEESEEEEEDSKEIVETFNPNRVVQKNKKLSELDDIVNKNVELTRREKEELAKQESARRYQQLHAQGKTDEARADLARLAIIRKQREDAARKREEEKKEKETRAHASKEASLNAIKNRGGPGRSKRN